jgi:hypothetical protein
MQKKLISSFTLFILMVLLSSAYAQINFFSIPSDFAIIPRNHAKNLGTFRATGEVTYPQYKTVELLVYSKGVLKSKISKLLSFIGSSSIFDLQITLPAGLINYDFQIYLTDNYGSYLKKTVNKVAFGDVILITGQSNSVAPSYGGLANTNYSDSFIRSFGNSTYVPNNMASDLNWYVADGDGAYSYGCVGQWGLVLAKQLVDSAKTPVCIINNGVGGTPIDYHLKNKSNPMDLNTSYGRQLYRASKAFVSSDVRFIYYYQGESDGSNAKLHDSLFKIIHRDWLTDFPTVQKVYVVQVRDGCGSPSLALREVQRQFEFNLTRTRVLTVNGFNGHDGCHFTFVDGYQSLGFEAAQVVLTDFYFKKTKNDVYPLNPSYAYFSKADFKEITIELNQDNHTLKADPYFYYLFNLEGTTSSLIIGGNIVNNKIVLQLSDPVCKIPGLSYNGGPGSKPWVKNLKGTGLLSFYNLPVYATKRISPQVFVCKGQMFKLRCDSLPGYSYQWKSEKGSVLSNAANLNTKLDVSSVVKLIIKDKLNICKADTQIVSVIVESIPNPNFNDTYHLCLNDSLATNLNNSKYKVSWLIDNYPTIDNLPFIKKSGTYCVKLTSTLGCTIADTFKVTQAFPMNLLDSLYRHCPDNPLLLRAPKGMLSYVWNTDTSYNKDSLLVDAGQITLMTKDSNLCSYHDTSTVSVFTVNQVNIETHPVFCSYNDFIYIKPISALYWYWNSKEITQTTYSIHSTDSINLVISDSNLCQQHFTIKPKEIIKPIQSNNRFLLCEGERKLVKLDSAYTYKWKQGQSGANLQIEQAGIYHFTVIDNYCEFYDSITVYNSVKPNWNIPKDTILCLGERLILKIPKTITNVKVNKVAVTDSIVLQHPQGYVISGVDSNQCLLTWNVIITEKSCDVSISNIKSHNLLIYPNPCHSKLFIQSSSGLPKHIQILNTLGQSIDEFEPITSSGIYEYDVSQFKRGLYYLKLIELNDISYFKLLIE